jgi:chromate transport protein ChrA
VTAADGTAATTWTVGAGFLGALVATTCCALPSLLVAFGLGGAVASVVSAVPAVTWLSAQKLWVFVVVGTLLALSWTGLRGRLPTAWLRARLCPVGGAPPNVWRLWRLSLALYLASVAVAYLGAPIARLILE